MNTALRIPRAVSLAIVSTLVTLGVIVSFMESYRALYWWAQTHQVHGQWAAIWPIQIDAFIAVGELALFVALVDLWHVKHRALPWLITAAGLAVSVAGNVGHVVTHNVFDRLTAAVPPLTAYVMLAAALGLLKRVIANAPKLAAVKAEAAAAPVESAPYGLKKDGTPRAKPGPVQGTPKRSIPKAVEAAIELPDDTPATPNFAETLKAPLDGRVDTGNLFRTVVPNIPPVPVGFDPDATGSFPKLDVNGQPVNGRH